MKLFDNTEVAFALKSDSQLERAYFLFKMIQNQPMVRIGSAVTNFALKAHLPIEGLIRTTVFDHFCGGVTEEDCLPIIDNMYKNGNVHSVLDYSVEGKDKEVSFDGALKTILKIVDFCEEKKSIPFAVFKPSGFGRFALYQKISEEKQLTKDEEAEWKRVLNRFHTVCKAAQKKDVPLLIDAEESWMQKAADELIEDLMETYNTEKAIVFNTLQMYRHDRLDYLKELHGEDEVPIIHVNDYSKEIEKSTLKELIERLQGGDKTSYFRYYNLISRHPEHLSEIDLPWIKKYVHKNRYFESFQAFLGATDTRTELHNAHISNFFIQVNGIKEWILYPNYFVPFIDPPSTMNGIYRTTPIRSGGKPFNPFNPDDKGYPYFKYLDGYKVILEPGDVFYNPPFMWHAVKNISDTIGLGFRWINMRDAFFSSPTYYLLDVLSYRPNYIKALKMTKKDANDQFLYMMKKMKRRMKK